MTPVLTWRAGLEENWFSQSEESSDVADAGVSVASLVTGTDWYREAIWEAPKAVLKRERWARLPVKWRSSAIASRLHSTMSPGRLMGSPPSRDTLKSAAPVLNTTLVLVDTDDGWPLRLK